MYLRRKSRDSGSSGGRNGDDGERRRPRGDLVSAGLDLVLEGGEGGHEGEEGLSDRQNPEGNLLGGVEEDSSWTLGEEEVVVTGEGGQGDGGGQEGGVGRVLLQRWRVNRRGGGANGSWRGEGRMYRSPVGCGMGCGMGRGIGCVGVRVVDGGRV